MEKQLQNSDILIYFPMMISSDGSVQSGKCGATSEDWDKLRALSLKDQDILTSKEIFLQLQFLQKKFGLNNASVAYISLFIRKIFFKEMTLQECEVKIASMLEMIGGRDPHQAKDIVLFIQNNILTIEPKLVIQNEEEMTSKKTALSIPLLQALSRYERLGNQLITKERIRIKSQSDPVRPSLSYWIKCYRDELGVGHHDSVVRGNFLFRSENGKKLSSEDRERVSLLIKSIEENLPLTIDTEHQEILFPAFSTFDVNAPKEMKGEEKPLVTKPPVIPIPSQPLSPSFSPHKDTLRFSSNHIFPAEKEMMIKNKTIRQEVKKEDMKEEETPKITKPPVVPTPPGLNMNTPKEMKVEKKKLQPFIIKAKSSDRSPDSQSQTQNQVQPAFVMPEKPVKDFVPEVFEDADPFMIRPSQRDK